MSGRNLFETFYRSAAGYGPSSMCVFISHKSEDKAMARAVAEALVALEVNIYFDERDDCLRAAAASGDDLAVVKCIEDGLDRCSHLLGLITEQTLPSWWVPYEIGGAAGRKRRCAHLVRNKVTRLPSFIKAAEVLLDFDDLVRWVGQPGTERDRILQKVASFRAAQLVESYVPGERHSSEISYY